MQATRLIWLCCLGGNTVQCIAAFFAEQFSTKRHSKTPFRAKYKMLAWWETRYETQGIFARADIDQQIYKAESKGDAAGKAAKETVTLPVIRCDWAAGGRPAPLVMGQTQRSSLKKAEVSKGLIRTQGRMRQAQSSKVRLTIAKVFVVLFFYPHLCSPVAFRPSGWVHVWWVPAEAVSQFHKAPEDNSVLYQLQSNLHIQKYRGF